MKSIRMIPRNWIRPSNAPDGQRADRLRLAVKLLVEPTVQDSWGAQATLKYTRLRYGIAIVRRTDDQGLDRL